MIRLYIGIIHFFKQYMYVQYVYVCMCVHVHIVCMLSVCISDVQYEIFYILPIYV